MVNSDDYISSQHEQPVHRDADESDAAATTFHVSLMTWVASYRSLDTFEYLCQRHQSAVQSYSRFAPAYTAFSRMGGIWHPSDRETFTYHRERVLQHAFQWRTRAGYLSSARLGGPTDLNFKAPVVLDLKGTCSWLHPST